MINKIPLWFWIFIPIFILGVLMRAPEVIGRNYLFGFDQGRDYMAVYKMVEERKITLIGAEVGAGSAGLSGLFHGPGYYYLVALMYIIFRGDPYGGLLLMFGFGVATLIVVFITTKKMFGATTALMSLLLVGIAPLIAPQSRFLWNHHPTSFFIALYFFFIFKLKTNPTKYAVLAALMAGMLYHFELAISAPLVFLTIISMFWRKVATKKRLFFVLATIVFCFLPMIIFEARHDFMATRGMISYLSKIANQEIQEEYNLGSILQQRYGIMVANFRDTFVFESGFIRPQHMLGTMVMAIFFILIAYKKCRDSQIKKFFELLFLGIIITFLIFLPLNNAVWNYYLIHLHFVYIYTFAFAIVYFWRHFPKNLISIFGSVFLTLFLISMLLGTTKRLQSNYLVDMPDYGGKEKILGKKYIIDMVYKEAAGKPFSVHIFMPPVYTYPYDYLFLTYGKTKYGYLPTRDKSGNGYMIIELDGTKPDSYKGWLETVIIDGKVEWEKYINKSDHVLQKRIFH